MLRRHVFSVLTAGCSDSPNGQGEAGAAENVSQKTIVLSQKELPAEFQGKTIIDEVSNLDLAYFPTLEDTIPHAAAAVKATVNDISYTSIGSNAWTVVNVTVDDVLFGDVAPSSNLQIYAFGGYISMLEIAEADGDRERYADKTDDELRNMIVHQQADMEEPPLTGYQYIFFLGSPIELMPVGSYEKLGWKYCQMQVDAENEVLYYLPYDTSGDIAAIAEGDAEISTMTMDALTSLIEQYH